MSNTLLSIFRPTRKKIVWTFLTGVPLTAIGMFFAVVSVHGSDFFAYAGSVLLLPAFLLSKFMSYCGLQSESAAFFLPVLQLAYYYVLVSGVQFFRNARKEADR